jgi:predicted Zn-dependent peptidase
VVPNAFGALLQSAGGVGLNAATSQDSTRYFVSLPSNKLELWFALESQRFQVPVFR